MKTIDLAKVAEVMDRNKKHLPYDKYKHLFTKVAFDVFQLNNSPVESYWILEKGENGEEYLSANYEREQDKELTVKSSWEALSDKESKNVTLLYKGVPIKRFASAEYKFDEGDVNLFKNALVAKLSVSKEFVDKLIKVLAEEKRDALIEVFPELAL